VDFEAVDDLFSRWLRRSGVRTRSVIVLRPDKFVSVTNRGDHERATAAAHQRLVVGAR
jgi:hypothetical protein